MQSGTLVQTQLKPVSKCNRPSVSTCCKAQQNNIVQQKPKSILRDALSAGLIASTLFLSSGPSMAEGVITKDPQLRNIFFSEKQPEKPVQKQTEPTISLPSLPSISFFQNKPAAAEPSVEGEFNPVIFAVPVTFGALAAGTVVWKILDPTFDQFWEDGLLNDSNILGIGYEVDIKKIAGVLKKETGKSKTVKPPAKANVLQKGALKIQKSFSGLAAPPKADGVQKGALKIQKSFSGLTKK